MEKNYNLNGYVLHLLPTPKFKTVSLSLRLQSPLSKETTTLRTLLTFVLSAATQELPSSKLISQFLDDQYGARLSANISTKGKSHIINVYSSFVNERFLPTKASLFVDQLKLINDLFKHPYASEGAFNEEIVAIKKKELKERLQAQKDDKFGYSVDKLFEYMGEGHTLGISSTGYEDEIDQISAKDLYEYFLKCINDDVKHLYIVGDIDESIVDICKEHISFPVVNESYETAYIFNSERKDVLEVIEKQDLSQSKLNMGYTTHASFMSEDHYAFTLFNAIYGGFSQSKLFQVVREQNSLCYYVSSSYDAFNGIMLVNAGIESKDYDKAKQLITAELEKIQNGVIDPSDVEMAKGQLCNSLRKAKDDPGSIIALAYNKDITGHEDAYENYLEKLMSVSLEDIQKVAQGVKLDTIYFLTGKEFDGNNTL